MTALRSVALPMYLSKRQAVVSLWDVLQTMLQQAGCAGVPRALDWPEDLLAHWRDPQLLLGQTCGYPLTHALAGAVQLVGVFRYNAPGCDGIFCRSQLVARTEDADRPLADFRGLRVAFNSDDSQSGYNALRAAVAPLARDGRFFGEVIATGGHAASMAAVQQGHADIAAIDCVTLDGLRRNMQQTVAGLCTIGQTQAYPGLPLITGKSTSAAELRALQAVLAALVQDPAAADALAALGIVGFQTLPLETYQVCVDMRLQAQALGYAELA
jgi:ABC-type phosphate/phosphonate transport system substrate-binding protein